MTRKKRTSKRVNSKHKPNNQSSSQPSLEPEAGKLWIHPELNRKISGPGGNRGEHTTPAAELLRLADIVLKKRSGQ